MMLEAEYVQPLFRKCAEFQTKVAAELIKRGVDAIWYGDDFGTQNSLLMPPDIFTEQVKPWYKNMNQELKKLNPDIVLILHSDGAVAPLLPDIKDMGFHYSTRAAITIGISDMEIPEAKKSIIAESEKMVDKYHLISSST